MNSEKKLEIKRIVIFCVLSVLPLAIVVVAISAVYKKPMFADEGMATIGYVVAALAMFAPAIANVLTRLITKEGFKDLYLAINFKGNGRYYAASVLVKVAEVAALIVLIWLVFFGSMGFGEMFATDYLSERWGTFVAQIGFSIVMFLPAFGEEFGWRAYLMPKLMGLCGKPEAMVIGGIIWGLWHAPLTVCGHNFGVDYPGFPWLGILMMCLMCTLINPFFTLLTERTKSVYPAAFAHMVNNNISFAVTLSIFGSEAVLEKLSEMSTIPLFWLMMPVIAVTGIVSFVILMKQDKTQKENN